MKHECKVPNLKGMLEKLPRASRVIGRVKTANKKSFKF